MSLHESKLLILDQNVSCFISKNTLSFTDAINLLKDLCKSEPSWRLASIAEIEMYEKELRSHVINCQSSCVWVSDLLEIDLGTINIPKFYSCDISLSKPKNGSIALNEQKCLALFFKGE
jgi:hypothetical protein